MSKFRITTKTVVLFAVILTVAGFFLWDRDLNPFPQAVNASESKKERLFRKLGILPLSHIAGPIDFTLNDLSGNPVRLSNFKGKIVFLNFWTTWCPDCRIEMPSMQKLHERFKDKDFVMITVSLKEPAQRVKEFFNQNRLTFIGLLDSNGEVGGRLGIRSIPTTFIIDRNGNISGTVIGSRKWNSKRSFRLFEHLTNPKEGTSL